MTPEDRYEVQYRNHEGIKISLCVNAQHVTEAIEAARSEIPALKSNPGRIFSVIRGCDE